MVPMHMKSFLNKNFTNCNQRIRNYYIAFKLLYKISLICSVSSFILAMKAEQLL